MKLKSTVLLAGILFSTPAFACDDMQAHGGEAHQCSDASHHSDMSKEHHEKVIEKKEVHKHHQSTKASFVKANTFFKVEGMKCGNCVNNVANAVKDLNGVLAVEVDLDSGKASLLTSGKVNDQEIAEAVKKAGYQASKI